MTTNHLTFPNLIQIFYKSKQPLNQLKKPLQQFLKNEILNKRKTNTKNIIQTIDTLINNIQKKLTKTTIKYKLKNL